MTHHGVVFVCAEHRFASHWNPCPCGKDISMSPRWRAPKKTNDKAWKMIQSGDFLWDKRAKRRRSERARRLLGLPRTMKERTARHTALRKRAHGLD